MKKTLSILIMTIFIVQLTNAQAQSDKGCSNLAGIQSWEGELFGGFALPIGEAEYGTKKIGWNAGAEVRYNFNKLPIDVGLQYSHVSTNASMTTYRQNSIKAVGDWNFFLPALPKLTPFVGAGIGVGWCENGTFFTAMPRVGLEFDDFLRLTFATQISRRYYHNAQISLGFVLGGRKSYAKKLSFAESLDMDATKIEPQPETSPQATEIFNLKKNRDRFKSRSTTYGILGGVSLGMGAFLLTNGIIGLSNNHNGNPETTFYGIIFTGAGGLFTLGSVPFFIACHHQGVRAAELTAKIDMLSTTTSTPAPALTLSLAF